MTRVLVCGGLILDITFEITQWPEPQGIVQSPSVIHGPGGKGINQAVAARRLGAESFLLGSRGNDMIGQLIMDSLAREKVNTDLVYTHPTIGTGMVSILLYHGSPGFVAA